MRVNYQRPRCAQNAPLHGRRRGRGGPLLRWIGGALMMLGLLILVVALPVRFWFALVGVVLLAVGFILWFLA